MCIEFNQKEFSYFVNWNKCESNRFQHDSKHFYMLVKKKNGRWYRTNYFFDSFSDALSFIPKLHSPHPIRIVEIATSFVTVFYSKEFSNQ